MTSKDAPPPRDIINHIFKIVGTSSPTLHDDAHFLVLSPPCQEGRYNDGVTHQVGVKCRIGNKK